MSDINGSPTGPRPGGGPAARLSPPVFGQQATVRIESDAVAPGPPADQGGPPEEQATTVMQKPPVPPRAQPAVAERPAVADAPPVAERPAVAEPVAPAESMRPEAVVVDAEAPAGGVPSAATSAEEASA